MKNKAGYILLPLVVAVWGLIGYRVIGFLKQDTISTPLSKTEEINISPNNLVQDTFLIEANYRDPFLANIYHEPHSNLTLITNAPRPRPLVVEKTEWPALNYYGSVKNNNSNKVYAILSINKKMKNVTINDVVDGLKILSIQRESVEVMFKNKKEVFND